MERAAIEVARRLPTAVSVACVDPVLAEDVQLREGTEVEVIGLNAIAQSRYPCNAVALDSVMLCRFSFPNIAALATRMPGLPATAMSDTRPGRRCAATPQTTEP